MKELDTKEMDKEEKELYQMLRSKFNTKEMERLAKLMIIDAEKYHQEQLNKNCVLDLVSISYSDKRKFVKCRNVYKTSWESTTRKVDENCKLHFLSGAEFIYNRILERLPNEC